MFKSVRRWGAAFFAKASFLQYINEAAIEAATNQRVYKILNQKSIVRRRAWDRREQKHANEIKQLKIAHDRAMAAYTADLDKLVNEEITEARNAKTDAAREREILDRERLELDKETINLTERYQNYDRVHRLIEKIQKHLERAFIGKTDIQVLLTQIEQEKKINSKNSTLQKRLEAKR